MKTAPEILAEIDRCLTIADRLVKKDRIDAAMHCGYVKAMQYLHEFILNEPEKCEHEFPKIFNGTQAVCIKCGAVK